MISQNPFIKNSNTFQKEEEEINDTDSKESIDFTSFVNDNNNNDNNNEDNNNDNDYNDDDNEFVSPDDQQINESPNVIANLRENLEDIYNKRNEDPFDFIYKYCENLYIKRSDPNSIDLVKQLITQVTVQFKQDSSFWIKEKKFEEEKKVIDEKKGKIKNTLLALMSNPNELIYTNAALSYFIIGSIEFPNNDWPSFFSDIFTFLSDFIKFDREQPGKQIEPKVISALIILQYSIENQILTQSYGYFDICVRELWNIFHYFLPPNGHNYNIVAYDNKPIETQTYAITNGSIDSDEGEISIDNYDRTQNTKFTDYGTLAALHSLGIDPSELFIPHKNEQGTDSDDIDHNGRIDNLITEISRERQRILIYLYRLKKRCFSLLKASIDNLILDKIIKLPLLCSQLVDLMLLDHQLFYTEVYDVLISLFKHYFAIIPHQCIQSIFEISIHRLNLNLDILSPALNFWMNIADIDFQAKQTSRGPNFVNTVYQIIFPKLFELFENYYNDYDIDENKKFQQDLEKCIFLFAKAEPKETLPYILSSFCENILKRKSDLEHYKALRILKSTIKLVQFDVIYPNLTQIFECAENESQDVELTILTLNVTSKIIKYFHSKLRLDDVKLIIEMCELFKFQYIETYKVLSNLIIAFNNSINGIEGFIDFKSNSKNGFDYFNQVKQIVLDGFQKDISPSYPAIIALIETSQDQEFVKSQFKTNLERFQNLNINSNDNDNSNIIEFDILRKYSNLCQILKCCIVNLKNHKVDISTFKDSKAITSFSKIVIRNFGNSFDEDLLDLYISFISYTSTSANKSTNQEDIENMMNIVVELFFETNNDQRIIIASEFISELATSKLSTVNYAYLNEHKIFETYENILKDESILKSVHGPVISSISYIMNSLKLNDQESDEIKNRFMPIIENFVNTRLDTTENEYEYANDLFESICRFYIVLTNSIKDTPEAVNKISKSVLSLFKRIHQLKLYVNNETILQFIDCIVYNLNSLKKYKKRIAKINNFIKEFKISEIA